MNDDVIVLMHNLLEYHDLYENDYESFGTRYNFEVTYWFNFRKLKQLIDLEFQAIRPFHNHEDK